MNVLIQEQDTPLRNCSPEHCLQCQDDIILKFEKNNGTVINFYKIIYILKIHEISSEL